MNRRRASLIQSLALSLVLAAIAVLPRPSGANDGESPAESAKVIRMPVDSSQVIPAGPQWLGAPIMPGGTRVAEDPSHIVTEYDLPYDQVFAWYKAALARYPDARYRDWKEEMYIEDQGGSKWHAIKISKTGPKISVTIKKDNWTWIFSTLLIRFVGVFVVLLVLWIFLNLSGVIMGRFFKEEEPA